LDGSRFEEGNVTLVWADATLGKDDTAVRETISTIGLKENVCVSRGDKPTNSPYYGD